MSRIFISYRRDDSAADMTDRLYERLAQLWGQRVFMDIDSLIAGDLFEKTIEENLQNCSVMLVIIGRHWSSLTDEAGLRRIDNPRDYPRMEVAAALRRGVRVIPVLVGDASMPTREELPQDIVGLLERQYMRISRERFAADAQRLIEAVAREMPRSPWRQLPRWAIPAAVAMLAAVTAAYFTVADHEPSKGPGRTTAAPSVEGGASPLPAGKEEAGTPPDAAAVKPPAGPAGAGSREAEPASGQATGPTARREKDGSTAQVDVSGRWGTAPIDAAYGNPRFTLQFEFTQMAETLLGTVTEVDEGRSRGVTREIFDGTIRKNVISFHTKGELIGGRDGTTTPYKEMYIGTLRERGREIAFRRFTDVPSGGEIENFVATR